MINNRVLIIEDDTDLSSLFLTVLETERLDIEVCRDGFNARRAIQDLNPGLIILDMHLPFVSGAELFDFIKERYPDIIILIVTADRSLFSKYKKKTKAFLKPMGLEMLRDEVLSALAPWRLTMSTVLIVEDNVDLSTLFKVVLEIDKIDSEICRDGRDAIPTIKKLQPSVIILDMHLPHVDGDTIYEYVTEHHPEIEVLIVTADREKFSTYSAIANAFLKPMDMNVLRREVKAAL